MKDHVKVSKYVYGFDTPEELIKELDKATEGLSYPTIEIWEGNIEITGWRKMTEKEFERAKKKRKKDRERKLQKKAEDLKCRREEYLKLKAEFEGDDT